MPVVTGPGTGKLSILTAIRMPRVSEVGYLRSGSRHCYDTILTWGCDIYTRHCVPAAPAAAAILDSQRHGGDDCAHTVGFEEHLAKTQRRGQRQRM